MPRLAFPELVRELHAVLTRYGVPAARADLVARLFAENERDGIYSHGVLRFPGFIELIKQRRIDPQASPTKVGGMGALEQWDGHLGIGLSNAHTVMTRAIELSRQHGLGCIGLRNTNHWMRAGAYALQAADAGCVGICWTNTIPLMPPWGAAEVAIGNNPLAIAVPRRDGPLLLDMAMSQFANGKLDVFRRQGRTLPVPGGYDHGGELTHNPDAILASRRPLPIGYWKGSALAVMLDAAAALVSGGQTSQQIGRQETEYAVSQVFIAIDVTTLDGIGQVERTVNDLVDHLRATTPLSSEEPIRYPGEGMLRIRHESLTTGILVETSQLEALRNL